MKNISLRKLESSDKKYFAKWWRDKELLELTSGYLEPISDNEVNEYFQDIIENKLNYNFIITVDDKTIGHISLAKRQCNWHEIQIVIGEKEYWGKGYGSEAIKLLITEAKSMKISKIYLEVRPTNTRAIKAYENCGFKRIKKVFYPDNPLQPETIRMELR